MPGSPNTCGRKPYPERKSWGFKNIRKKNIPVDETTEIDIIMLLLQALLSFF